ncbi:MAG: alpha/beta hydrolase [Thermoleophilia bacterium]
MAARPLVLVPGACLGGWAWREVAGPLRAAGHEVFPVTLTGLGDRAHLASPEVTPDLHVQDVLGVLRMEDLRDAVLLGHSYSGPIVNAVARRAPERLAAVVFLDTGPLADGLSLADVQPPELRDRQRERTRRDGDGWLWPVPDDEEIRAGTYGSGAGLTDAHLARIRERGTPQPYATLTTPIAAPGPWPAGVARHAVVCTEGGFTPAAIREAASAGNPMLAPFAEDGWSWHELPTGHWPMFSTPGPLADLLHAIASG